MSQPPKQKRLSASPNGTSAHSGFSLIECIIALVILMVIALGVVFVFDFSFRNNVDSKKRFAALLLAQQRLETVRNTNFIDLTVGTVTENEVISDGIKFKVVRTVTANDLVTTATAPGPETKSITITVSPFESLLAKDAITLVTIRAGTDPVRIVSQIVHELLIMMNLLTTKKRTATPESGFSLIEMIVALTLTIIIATLAFALLAKSLNRKINDQAQVSALADANQALSRMSNEIGNSGFGLSSNGLVLSECTEEKIRVRANLNALMQQTSSGAVTDPEEDIIYHLVSNLDGGSALVRTDVNSGETTIISSLIDNKDINGDGDGDGLTFSYLDSSGNEVSPAAAVQVLIVVRITLPQVGAPDSPGYQPETSMQLSSSVILLNSRLLSY